MIDVATLLDPFVEGTVTVADGRRLGFAEFGDPHGRAVLWMHGTPGARLGVSHLNIVYPDNWHLKISLRCSRDH